MLLNTSIGLDGNNFHPSSASRTFHAGWRLIKNKIRMCTFYYERFRLLLRLIYLY